MKNKKLSVSHNGKELFSHEELSCRENDISHRDGIIPDIFLSRIKTLRLLLNKPIYPTSVCRSRAYNETLPNSSPRSFHVFDNPHYDTGGCIAMDIARINKNYDRELIELCFRLGFSIGISNRFIHIDDRTVVLGMKQAKWFYKGYTGNRFDDIFDKDKFLG